MNISFEQVKKLIDKYGYEATEELQYETYLALLNFGVLPQQVGQDIYTLCLEGPPGAGKTEFVTVYSKVVNEVLNRPVTFIKYQCNSKTGESSLIEEVNVTAAITGDESKVIIPGKIIQAIEHVNNGEKVILFLDEYDKAREETDDFLLDFLQSGSINSIQSGDLSIKDAYKNNLQVFLCKNDKRETLSGPLSRRVRRIALEYMTPTTFQRVAQRRLIDEVKEPFKVEGGLINLVALLYRTAYNTRDIYTRVPACSELLIALQDANELLKYATPPSFIIYNKILHDMFKEKADIDLFIEVIEKDPQLKAMVDAIKNNTQTYDAEQFDKIMANLLFADTKKRLDNSLFQVRKLQAEMKTFLEEQKRVFSTLDGERTKIIREELEKIKATMLAEHKPNISFSDNFQDVGYYLRRGKSINRVMAKECYPIGKFSFPHKFNSNQMNAIINWALQEENLIVFEDGFMLEDEMFSWMGARQAVEDKDVFYFYGNTELTPLASLQQLMNFVNNLANCMEIDLSQVSAEFTTKMYTTILVNLTKFVEYTWNETMTEGTHIEVIANTEDPNVYSLNSTVPSLKSFNSSLMSLNSYFDKDNYITASQKGKVKIKEGWK